MRDSESDGRSSRSYALPRRGLLRASGALLGGSVAFSGGAVGAADGGEDADGSDGSPSVAWNRTYGDERRQRGLSVLQASDGGFVVTGETGVDSPDDHADALVVKTGPAGDVEWVRTYGGEGYQSAAEIRAAPGGGYVLMLDVRAADAETNHVAAAGLTEDGTVRWWREYEFGDATVADAVRRSDGGYAVVGTLSGDAPAEAFVVALDDAGEREWVRTYDAAASLFGRGIVEAEDGFGLLAFTAPAAFDRSPVLVRTGPDGTERWRRRYEIRGFDVGEGLVRGTDGGFAVAGSARAVKWTEYIPGQPERDLTAPDAFLLKVDAEGDRRWAETFGAPGPEYASAEAAAVVRRPGGGYAFAGTRSAGWASPFWVVGTDADGECRWQRRAGGRQYNYPFSIVDTADGGYAVAGFTTDGHPAEPDFRLVRLTAES